MRVRTKVYRDERGIRYWRIINTTIDRCNYYERCCATEVGIDENEEGTGAGTRRRTRETRHIRKKKDEGRLGSTPDSLSTSH